jgi:hypothetical protein
MDKTTANTFLLCLSLALLSILPFSVGAEDPTPDPGAEGQQIYRPDLDAYTGRQQKTDATLQRLLEIPEVKTIYEGCKGATPNKVSDISTCTWKKVQDAPSVAKKVMEVMGDKKANPTADGKQYEGLELTTSSAISDPALDSFKKYLFQKFELALYGEKKKQFVDHTVFYSLYNTQMGKNFINALSWYCLQAESTNFYLIFDNETKREQTVKANMEALKNFKVPAPDANNPKPNIAQKESGAVNEAYNNWATCAGAVQAICYQEKHVINNKDTPYEALDDTNADFKYSQQRACQLTRYLKDLRQNILYASKVEKTMADKPAVGAILETSGKDKQEAPQKTPSAGKIINELTTVTSNEVANKSGLSEQDDLMAKEIDKCLADNNPQLCQKYLHQGQGKEELQAAAVEYDLRTRAMEQKIVKIDNAGVKQYLTEEGYQQDKIDEIMADQSKIDSFKQAIAKRYTLERQKVIEGLNEQFRRKTVKGAKYSQQDDQNVISDIKNELSSRAEQLKQLTYYNNMVSGYLKLHDNNRPTIDENNYQTIFLELSDNAYTKGNGRSTASTGNAAGSGPSAKDVEEVQAKINEQGIKEKQGGMSDGSSGAKLEVDTINNYFLTKPD